MASTRIYELIEPTLCVSPLDHLPLQLGQTSYYWIFFYVGWLFRKKHVTLENRAQLRNVCGWLMLFLFIFSVYTVFREVVVHQSLAMAWGEWEVTSLLRVARMVTSLIGVYALMLLSLYVTARKELPIWWVRINADCFGIYLIHHFILPLLYYHTSLPSVFGTYGLPWVGLFVSFTLSLGMTVLIRKTRCGRWLVG